MTPSELLERLSRTLKDDIGPAVVDAYPRTQAYLMAVVLQKLARQVRHAEAHAAAERRDRDALERDLEHVLDNLEAPPVLRRAFEALCEEGGNASLCRFIETLYASREALGTEGFERLLGRVRKTLRASLERRLEIAS